MSTTIDIRLTEGQQHITDLRAELAQASSALDTAQRVLADGDRLLEQIDAGLSMAEAGIEKGRRVFPKLVVVVAIVGVSAATVTVIKRRKAAADPAP